MRNIYVLIIKSQLSNGFNRKVNFQKTADSIVHALLEIFVCHHMNQRLAILRDVAEVRIEFWSFLQSHPGKESFKISKLGVVSLIIFLHQKSNATDQN